MRNRWLRSNSGDAEVFPAQVEYMNMARRKEHGSHKGIPMNQLKDPVREAKSAEAMIAMSEEDDVVKWDLGLFFGFFLWLVIVTVGYWGYKSGLLLLGA